MSFGIAAEVMGKGDLKMLERYLYEHTKVVAFEGNESAFQALIVTVAETPPQTRFLAEYQHDRLRSGLMGVKQLDSMVTQDGSLI